MNIHSIVQLSVIADLCNTTKELVGELESLLHSYQFDFYGFLFNSKPHDDIASVQLAARWPEGWPEAYAAKKYFPADPVIRVLGVAQRPFRWREAMLVHRSDPHRKRMERMMQDAARHGLKDGYVFPVHGRGGLLAFLSVGGGRQVDLSPVEMVLFEAAAKKVFWRFLELNGRKPELDQGGVVGADMTRREMEVISLLADGLTSHEIGKVLNISNHTVDWYINGIQDKLKAKNRQHVVALAFRLGFVS